MRTPLIFAYWPPCASDETVRQTLKMTRPVEGGRSRRREPPVTAANATASNAAVRIYSDPDHRFPTLAGGDPLGAFFLLRKRVCGARQACFNVEASDIHQ